MAELFTAASLVTLVTLTLMEIVLGIDNIVFISILTSKLPKEQEPRARQVGLSLALVLRLGLLFTISWIMGLTRPLFSVGLWGFLEKPWEFTGQKLILLAGGLFLVAKSTHEIYDKLEGGPGEQGGPGRSARFGAVIAQILALDLVFSLDSVITAVGMATPEQIPVMAAAMILAVVVMLAFAGAVGGFVNRHPSMKILALSFLLLIGVMLVAEGWGKEVDKGYVYFAMAFALGVEMLNIRLRKKAAPIGLRHARMEEDAKKEP